MPTPFANDDDDDTDDVAPAPTREDDNLDQTDEDPKPIVVERTLAPAPKRTSPVVLIGLGLAATLAVGLVIALQSREPEGDTGPSKPNRSEAGPAEVGERTTQPRPPGNTRTKLRESDSSSHPAGSTGGDTTDTGTEVEPKFDPNVDPRDPSVIPAGTPVENAKAFSKLPVSVHDGPPLGGIGRTGIHVDAVETGRDYRNGECKDETRTFTVAADKEVSVCFRVVHERKDESVRVLWDKDGVTTRRGGVRIRDLHAYKTRAYLELRPEYVGSWRVRIISDDDVELAVSEFEIRP